MRRLSGKQYTWASRREAQTYENLNRVLTNIEWEQKFPLVLVHALTCMGSGHTLFLIDSGEQAHLGNKTFSHLSFL
jgi:hypothetical protein